MICTRSFAWEQCGLGATFHLQSISGIAASPAQGENAGGRKRSNRALKWWTASLLLRNSGGGWKRTWNERLRRGQFTRLTRLDTLLRSSLITSSSLSPWWTDTPLQVIV